MDAGRFAEDGGREGVQEQTDGSLRAGSRPNIISHIMAMQLS